MNVRKEYRILARNDTKTRRNIKRLTMTLITLDKVEGDSVSEVVRNMLCYKPRTPKWKEYRL